MSRIFGTEVLVWETSTTTGTGNFSLAGASSAETGLRTFAGAGLSGVDVPYMIRHQDLNEWEFGVNLITSGTLTRDSDAKVYRSSNSNNRVSFSAGTKNVTLFDHPGFTGGFEFITVDTTLGVQHDHVVVSASLARTITLPDAGSFDGKSFTITNGVSGQTHTIARSGTDVILAREGSSLTSIPLYLFMDTVTLVSAGAGGMGWYLVKDNRTAHTAKVRKISSQATTNNVTATLTYDSEVFDPANLHDNSTNNSRITFKRAGKYQVGGGIDWQANSTGLRYHSLVQSGSTGIAVVRRNAVLNTETVISTIVDVAAGDYVEMQVIQDSGGSLDVLGTTSSNLWVAEIR